MRDFVNRHAELRLLERWWSQEARLAVVWGRRRVGKTALLQHFAQGKPAAFHTGAGRGEAGELRMLSEQVAKVLPGGLRDLSQRPYTSWDDALDDLGSRTQGTPALLVLDEFPELVDASPALPGVLRAFLDRAGPRPALRILLCGSAVRYMQALQADRQPLYGRFDLALPLHPFAPHEAALMLTGLAPREQALVYGVVGGMPLYLTWWDQTASVEENIERLVCQPGGRLLTEGDLVLRTEVDGGEYAHQVLHAIAGGRTQYGQIKSYLRAEPARALERLIELRLVERFQPVGSSMRSTRRSYRIIDPFLAFHLGVVAPHRTEIERGLGAAISPVLRQGLDDHLGPIWEELLRHHLRRLAARGDLDVVGDVVAVGPWWDGSAGNEIDAVVLAGRSRRPVLVAEAKWSRTVDAARLVRNLRKKVEHGLGLDPDDLRYAVCARETIANTPDHVLGLTAADIFAPSP